MCGLFGFLDYQHTTNSYQVNRIIRVLAREAEERGTDAAGIAYLSNDTVHIYKRPLPAHKMRFHTPKSAHIIMGHTRMATKGSEKINRNNHPFPGRSGNIAFALAHNGVVYNDDLLRIQHGLPESDIETDSYIAVQLLEQNKALNSASLISMAENVKGSFSFTVLDQGGTLSFVKGDNPLCIRNYTKQGYYLYASTSTIMNRACRKLGIHRDIYRGINMNPGDVLQISPDGQCTWDTFQFDDGLPHGSLYHTYQSFFKSPSVKRPSPLLETAGNMGIERRDIRLLMDYGYTEDDIEELLNFPYTLQQYVDEIRFEEGWI